MKFTPLKFQIPLAAGGVALMAFNYLQFAVPHEKGLIKLSDMPWAGLTTLQISLYLLLIILMLAFSVINLCCSVTFMKDLCQWLTIKGEYQDFIKSPPTKSIGIFVPVASLSMTANVILAPLAFFVPLLSSNLQAMMLPGLIFFGILWSMVFMLEFKVLKTCLKDPIDATQLNFIWLLDVFAFGLVSLTGTGIAVLCDNRDIASIAAFASMFTLSIGFFLFVAKLAYLIYLQLKAGRLPEKSILPAFFLVIPITCLLGFSFYRITLYLQMYFPLDTKMLSFVILGISYIITITWGIFCLYLLRAYFREDFLKSDFYPTQWGLV